VTEFSERDLDRSWSAGELAQLSERELTKLAFRRALKNAAFFVPTAVIVGLIAGGLGLTGKIIGWLAIFGSAVIALVGVVAGKYPSGCSGVSWRLLQLLVALANAALYAGLAAWVYTRMKA